MTIDARTVIAQLRTSQDRLAALAAPLTAEQLRQPSYDDDWTVAALLSHLGSQAELMDGFLAAGIAGEDPPSRDSFPAVWDRWNAMTPEDQRDGALETTEAHLARFEAMTDAQLEAFDIDLFGIMQLDATGFAQTRLGEHALHTWDLAVVLDPTATVPEEASALIVDSVGALAARAGRAEGTHVSLRVDTASPTRSFALVIGDGVSISPWADGLETDGTLRLPAEALVRLVYGRLDAAHTPDAVQLDAESTTLDDLRGAFPGV
jgi:uncharacterized protein (TIGR03083 family)